MAGWLYHFAVEGKHEAIETHLVERPEFDIDVPHGIIVIEDLNLHPEFNKMKVLRAATYDQGAVSYLCGLIPGDLKSLPTYAL